MRADLTAARSTVEGDWTASATKGALDLAPARGAWSIAFSGATGWVVTREVLWVGTDPNARLLAPDQPTPRNETITWGNGTLSGFKAGEDPRILLLAEGGGTLGGSGSAGQTFDALPKVAHYAAASDTRGADDAFLFEAQVGWLAARGLPAAGAQGGLTLFFADADAQLVQGEEARTLETRPRSQPESGPGGLATGVRDTYSFYVVRLSDAHLVGDAGGSSILAPEAAVHVEGAWSAARAHGYVVVDGERHEVRGETVRIDGALDATMHRGEAAPLGALSEAPTSQLDGRADRLTIGGAAVEARPVAAAMRSPAAAATGIGLAVVLLGWLLYTRLERSTLLRNPNRARVYHLIRGRAGLSLADLVRETGMPQVVVRHHLRILEQHRYVAVRGEGRTRLWLALDGSVDPAQAGALVTLKDETRRAVAQALGPGPRSQREIAQATGLSQRLVSYHLARLEEGGLVVSEGSMPRRYRLADAARDLVGAQTGATTTDGGASA